MGGKLDWPATWRFVDPRVGTTDKEVGGREGGGGELGMRARSHEGETL